MNILNVDPFLLLIFVELIICLPLITIMMLMIHQNHQSSRRSHSH